MTTTNTRGRNKRPTAAEINSAWDVLRADAQAGNPVGAALLIALTENKPFMHADGGIYSVPGLSSGWRGDEHDPRDAILAKIRESDPQSKQLPENQ